MALNALYDKQWSNPKKIMDGNQRYSTKFEKISCTTVIKLKWRWEDIEKILRWSWDEAEKKLREDIIEKNWENQRLRKMKCKKNTAEKNQRLLNKNHTKNGSIKLLGGPKVHLKWQWRNDLRSTPTELAKLSLCHGRLIRLLSTFRGQIKPVSLPHSTYQTLDCGLYNRGLCFMTRVLLVY